MNGNQHLAWSECRVWTCGPIPEVPVELPLLPRSLPLPEIVELQTNGDEQLDEGDDAQQPVAASDGCVVAVRTHHTQL